MDGHALTNPSAWAIQNNALISDPDYMEMTGLSPMELIYERASQYMQLKNNNQMWYSPHQPPRMDAVIYKMLSESGGLEQFSAFQEIAAQLAEDERIWLEESGAEEINSRFEQQFTNDEDAINYLQAMPARDIIDTNDILEHMELNELANRIYDYGLLPNLITEINEKLIFPHWMEYWGSQGIEQTRENVEQSYDMLMNAKTVQDNVSAISWALHTQHQTGSMLDHFEQYSGLDNEETGYLSDDLLTELSNMNTAEWDEELRALGVQV